MSEIISIDELIKRKWLIIGDGYRAKNSELGAPGLPFARAGNVQRGFDFTSADHLRDDRVERAGHKISAAMDVVFTSKGTVGRFAQVRPDTERFVYSPQLCFWRVLDRKKIDPQFLFFWMQSPPCVVQFRALQSQTDMADYISLRDQRTIRIELPPIEQQREIARDLEIIAHAVHAYRTAADSLERLLHATLPGAVAGRVDIAELARVLVQA
jgi:type I restriction enzyme, S subunit